MKMKRNSALWILVMEIGVNDGKNTDEFDGENSKDRGELNF